MQRLSPEHHARMLATPPSSSDDDIYEALIELGHATRGSLRCAECGQEKDLLIELGEEPDYESQTAVVCADCLRAALALAEAQP